MVEKDICTSWTKKIKKVAKKEGRNCINNMKIDNFTFGYELGCFFVKMGLDPTPFANIKYLCPEGWSNHYYLYLLVVDKEIVYVGYTGNLQQRIRTHGRNLLFDEIWIMQVDKSQKEVIMEEEFIIDYTKPILNNTEFTTYESLSPIKNPTLERVLACIDMMSAIKNKHTVIMQNYLKKQYIDSLKWQRKAV